MLCLRVVRLAHGALVLWLVLIVCLGVFFFKQKTADEMRISDWSSDVCSSDLLVQDYGLDACPHHIADRAAFRHAAAEGKTAMEIEPSGKAADEVRQLYKWTCEHVNMQASRKRRANA